VFFVRDAFVAARRHIAIAQTNQQGSPELASRRRERNGMSLVE
jgi:hypothetical protein